MGVQAKAGPRAVHVGIANEKQAVNQVAKETQIVNDTQSRVVQVGIETPATEVRAVHGRIAVDCESDRFQAKCFKVVLQELTSKGIVKRIVDEPVLQVMAGIVEVANQSHPAELQATTSFTNQVGLEIPKSV